MFSFRNYLKETTIILENRIEFLANHPDSDIRAEVAHKAGPDVHVKMKDDPDPRIGSIIAMRIDGRNQEDHHMAELAKSKHSEIRASVAQYTSSKELHGQLSNDPSNYVSLAARRNNNLLR